MTLTAKDTPGTFTLIPEGTHVAVCYLLADLGEQPNPFKEDTTQHKIVLGFELPAERLDDGRPLSITQIYTLSLNEKATLRKHLDSWRGKSFEAHELEGFDVRAVVGKACQLSVVHKESGEKTWANIAGVMALPKGMDSPRLEGKALVYDLDQPDPKVYEALPDWIKKKIENGGGSLGLQDIPAQKPKAQEADALPF